MSVLTLPNNITKQKLTLVVILIWMFMAVFRVNLWSIITSRPFFETNKSSRISLASDTEEAGLTKKILIYDHMWMFFKHVNGEKTFHNCRYSNCILTNNRTLYQWKDWDAILWDNVFSWDYSAPPERHPNTRFVLMNRENPSRYGGLNNWPVIFNWTMTYRIDSDVPFRYGYVYKLSKPKLLNLPKDKTHLAAWMCSTSANASGRRQLRKELEKYMHIDIYGRTGPLRCNQQINVLHMDKKDTECRDMIGKKYKFYFSFENALCRDSFTEKLYSMLQQPIVPVVWSGGNLSLLAPPHSAINALDFDNAKDLVDYLKYLDGNDTAYFEYFEWKKYYGVTHNQDSIILSFCHLCASLHQNTKTQ